MYSTHMQVLIMLMHEGSRTMKMWFYDISELRRHLNLFKIDKKSHFNHHGRLGILKMEGSNIYALDSDCMVETQATS